MSTNTPEENAVFEFKALRTKAETDKVAQTIKEQLVEQRDANWGDLLSAAPRTLCSIGQCFVIAWSEKSDQIVQNRDGSIQPQLKTNLVDCTDLGRDAFREAETKVYRVAGTIGRIIRGGGAINDILDCLGEKDVTASNLCDEFVSLERFAKECVEDTESVVKRFKVWHELVVKIHMAYTAAGDEADHEKQKARRTYGPPNSIWNRVISAILSPIFSKSTQEVRKPKLGHHIERVEKGRQATQQKFNDIESVLRIMSSKEKTAEDVSRVLQDCRNNLSELMDDMKQLHAFFTVLNKVVGFIKKELESVESDGLSKGQIDDLRDDMSKLWAHYSIARDISSTYVEVSEQYIMHGINEVESLSKTRTPAEAVNELCRNIAEFSKNAQTEISALVEKRRQSLKDNLSDTGRKFEEIP